MRKILVQVTSEDIQEGVRENCLYCPVALALHRTLGTAPGRLFAISSYVGSNQVMIGGKKYFLPKVAVDAIANFDSGSPVELFSFEIEIEETK